ncbi:hypothetical protein BDQ17DRAFT_1340891 [Cyathus striatus]|nr:hypothetical protein BDQ17DRAFT_1340891 [Cyathus striatus]
MTSHTTPDALTSHPITLMVFSHTWKHGSYTSHQGIRGILRKYDETCTPRNIHLLELLSTSIYIGLLAHYVMLPPTKFHTSSTQQGFGLREYLLTIFALSLITSWSIARIAGPLLVILCLGLSFPNPIYPDTNLFGILLFSLLLSLCQLHFTYPPTPLLLFSSIYSFPLAVFIRRTGIFFAPIFLFLMFLLSYSMTDTFPPIWTDTLLRICVGPAPMQTRTALFCAVLVLLVTWGFVIMSLYSDDRWLRFSRPVGVEAQHSFFKCVTLYTRPYVFPAPLNLLAAVTVKIPIHLRVFFGFNLSVLSTVERVLWRITVGPFTMVLAGLHKILRIRITRTSDYT